MELENKIIPDNYEPNLFLIRHSAAHVLAQAVEERFKEDGNVFLGIGPPIENGFYYDFELPRPVNDDDIIWIEERMKQIIKGNYPFIKEEISVSEAKEVFKDQPYKLELIDELVEKNEEISIYRQDDFVDLCRGPHVSSTKDIPTNALKLTSVSGAYWKDDSSRKMLQRIYGTAWENKSQLKDYLWKLEEAKKRDHRKIGKELELFHIDESAPGMPYWLPKGFKVLTELINFWRKEHEERDYHEISTPIINDLEIFKTSGHLEHYKDNMFCIHEGDNHGYGIKPMNCPNAMVVFNLKLRSYRDLPLRFSDCDVLHRKEASGAVHGLLRTQKFQQDDAHIFITEDQIEEEYQRIFELADFFYRVFDLKYTFRLGTRPDGYIGELETWNKAENSLKKILNDTVGEGNYIIEEGDGAFYGPKIDILMEDAIGRMWQMGTIQLDFQLPQRFDCTYIDENGEKKHPIVIHRVIYGSLERFMGILIEHTSGNFPTWLAPVQVRILPVSDNNLSYAEKLKKLLRKSNLRVELDNYQNGGRLNARIRKAQLEKIPYMLIVGQKEQENNSVSVRLRTETELGSMKIQQFIDLITSNILNKKIELS